MTNFHFTIWWLELAAPKLPAVSGERVQGFVRKREGERDVCELEAGGKLIH